MAARADTWYALGAALAQIGDRAGAYRALRYALWRDAAHVDARLAMGRLLFDCGQVEGALACFEPERYLAPRPLI
jgi:tetratricopeptide (TPR) repeat protein